MPTECVTRTYKKQETTKIMFMGIDMTENMNPQQKQSIPYKETANSISFEDRISQSAYNDQDNQENLIKLP